MVIVLVVLVWLLLGIHSVWLFVTRYTQDNDLTTNDIWILVACLFLPIVTHFSTMVCYPNKTPRVIKKSIIKKKTK